MTVFDNVQGCRYYLHVDQSKLEYYNRKVSSFGIHAKPTFLVYNKFNVVFYLFIWFQPFNICTYCKYFIEQCFVFGVHVSAYPK